MEVSSVIRIADLACRRIASSRYDKTVSENEALRKRVAELEHENRNLRNGVPYKKTILCGDLLDKRICECDLSVRTINCLKGLGINTIGDLINFKLGDIARYRNVGKKTISEIKDFSMTNGLGLE
jgi:DNA-directed RNA polymerase alpha subunit